MNAETCSRLIANMRMMGNGRTDDRAKQSRERGEQQRRDHLAGDQDDDGVDGQRDCGGDGGAQDQSQDDRASRVEREERLPGPDLDRRRVEKADQYACRAGPARLQPNRS